MPHFVAARLTFDFLVQALPWGIGGWGGTLWGAAKTYALMADWAYFNPPDKPNSNATTRDYTRQFSLSNAPRRLIYGNTRLAGNIVFIEGSDQPGTTDKSWLNMVIVFGKAV